MRGMRDRSGARIQNGSVPSKTRLFAMILHLISLVWVLTAFSGSFIHGWSPEVRLVGGPTAYSGRIEAVFNGEWLAVCGLFWDIYDAMVVCRELEIYTTGIVVYPVAFYGSGVGKDVLLPHCNGGESEFSQCNIQISSYCSHDYDAAVDCTPYGRSLIDIRLVGGNANYHGLVEVLYDVNNGIWTTVCVQSWSNDETEVACRSLGYINGGNVSYGVDGEGSDLNIRCLGFEDGLQQCSFGRFPSCNSSYKVQLHCQPYDCAYYTCHENAKCDSYNYCDCLDGYYGNGLICKNIDECAEGSPCNENAICTDLDGSYECKCNEGYYTNGTICADIDECLEEHGCHKYADCINTLGSFVCVCQNMFYGDGFNCTRGPSHLDVRLVNGGNYYGRVEVFDAFTGIWGTVCGEYWDLNDGKVIGRQLMLKSRNIDIFSDVIAHQFGEGPNSVFLQLNCTGAERRLNDCSYTTYPTSCSHSKDAGIVFWPDSRLFDVRLRGHNTSWSGRVEILYNVTNNLWGTVCALDIDPSIAHVVCRQLEIYYGEVNISTISGAVDAIIYKKNCSGFENSLNECADNIIVSDCDHSNDVAVFCYPNSYRSNQVRLVGPHPWEGRVEILYNVSSMLWGTVCNDSDWDTNGADVLCKQLGYYSGVYHTNVTKGGARESFNILCSGNEVGIANCMVENQDCDYDIRVSCNPYGCSEDSQCHEMATCGSHSNCICNTGYRGSGSWCNNINECKEETYHCDENADCVDTVGSYMCECRENYTGDGLTCDLVDKCEAGLIVCPRNSDCVEDGGIFSCACHSNYTGNDCSCTDGDVVIRGSRGAGRVEICYNNTYGTVCDDYWDDLDAKVICRQLGYSATESLAVKNARFGEGSGSILFDDMHCTGDELNILNCSRGVPIYHSNCEHREDAGVICESLCEVGSVQLAIDGTRDWYSQPYKYPSYYFVKGELHRGVVTLCDTGGQYRPLVVCDDSWVDSIASVLCHELGFSAYGALALQTHSFHLEEYILSSVVTVTSVQCFGDKQSFNNCTWIPTNTDIDGTCTTGKMAELVCQEYSVQGSNCTNGDMRLANFTDDEVAKTRSGQLEVCINGAWGAVCNDAHFGFGEMAVACRHMGFSDEDTVLLAPLSTAETFPIFLDSLYCSGSETTLLDCSPFLHGLHQCSSRESVQLHCKDIDECESSYHLCQQNCNNTVGSYHCTCFPGYTLDDDGVTCVALDDCNSTGEVRLVNSHTASDGVVEVCFNGEYRLICDSFWDDLDVQVVCSQLGYNIGGVATPLHWPFERAFLLNKTNCNGSESNILQCSAPNHELGVVVDCPSSMTATVSCGVKCVEGVVRLNPLSLGSITDYFTDPERYTEDYYFVNGQLATGRVEVCIDGEYVTMCGDDWDNQDASVVCSQLGFSPYGALALDSSVFGSDGLQSKFGISCFGNETRLLDCSVTVSECSYLHQASVLCQGQHSAIYHNCTDGSVCLRNDTVNTTTGQGRLEICFNHVWGRVCGDQFGSYETSVACQSMGGFSETGAEVYFDLVDVGVEPIFLKSLACDGSESNLLECAEKAAPLRAISCQDSSIVGLLCEDIDECALEQDLCTQLCNNTIGSYICDCYIGYSLNLDQYSCSDEDECLDVLCDSNAACNNIIGSFDCTCYEGYTGNGTFCDDIDECEINHNCSHGCNNTIGSYECLCDPGFLLEPDGYNCTDVNECNTMLHNCSANAVCINMLGDYTCKCLPGYTGDGYNCTDIDECDKELHSCHYNARCFNSVPFYICECGEGYMGNGTHCEDVDECVSDHDCDKNALCNNTDGSYICSCKTGFHGNGSHCYCFDGHTQLVNGTSPTEGKVEICLNNSYGAVCDDYWDYLDAQVVCRQLGFDNGSNATTSETLPSNKRVNYVLDDVHCNGSEDSLLACRHTLLIHDCNVGEEAGVSCYNEFCADGTVRLFLGDDDVAFYHGEFDSYLYYDKDKLSRGRVQYCINQTYHGICGDTWEFEHASVVCRQLGLSPYGAIPVTEGYFGAPIAPLVSNSFGCNGSENILKECRRTSSANVMCNSNVAGVVCQSPFTTEGNCTTGEIKLNGSNLLEGRVEVCINNAWGTVCNNFFSSSDTTVICRNLGYNFTDSYSIPLPDVGTGPIFLDNLHCNGNERSILDCSVSLGVHSCSHEQDIAVRCVDRNECQEYNGGCEQICMDLIPVSRQHSGYVCQCEMGYSLDNNSRNCTDINECTVGEGPCHPNATCINTEGSFRCECRVGFYGSGVYCNETCIDGVIGLVSLPAMNSLMSGRLEVCYNHTIGSVCDDENWGEEEAAVVCHQLGFSPYGARVLFEEHTVRNILLTNIKCNGSEDNLLDCQFETYDREEMCEDHAGVICQDNTTTYSNCTTGEVRLAPGTTNFTITSNITVQGRLEICINHAWGSVCHDQFFGMEDARVACHQLGGFTYQGNIGVAVSGNGPVFLEMLQCQNDHLSLLHCPFSVASTCDHSNVLDLQCQDVDECGTLAHNCDRYATCNNTIGSYSCDCNVGFEGEGLDGTCQDRDECNEDTVTECHEFASCNNTVGTYACICNNGFIGNGINCTDVNECDEMNDCHVNANCFNSPGSYQCSCITGFTGNGVNCTDVNECDTDDNDCHPNALCINTVGSFTCNCSTGYEGNGTFCEDIDECQKQTDSCHELYAMCNNVDGSYECECYLGFTGDGMICENVNECENMPCHDDAYCDDTIGSYICSCHDGFTGSGHYCEDIDECEIMSHDCHVFANCNNVPGKFNCSCFEDFHGNGTFCTCEDGMVRLENGTSREGRVEVCYGGYYRTVCDDFWDVLEARVVCNQLNFSVNDTNAVPVKGGVYGGGVREILLDDLLCEGHETNLLNCKLFDGGNHDCDHSEDAGVRCESVCTENSIRVILGDGIEFYQTAMHRQAIFYDDVLSRGRVEVCVGGEYMAICADSDQLWDNNDAMVICKEIGLSPYGAIGLGSGFFNGDGLTVGVTKVQCEGNENSLADCTFENTVDSCQHHAGVICTGTHTQQSNCSDGDLRLVDGKTREGRVEVCFSQAWGSICREHYGSTDAAVICRQLNKTLGNLGPGGEPLTGSEFGIGQGPIFLDRLNCDMENERLLDCPSLFFLTSCTDQDTIGVRCNDIDECEYGLSNCVTNAVCMDLDDGYTCHCSDGYSGNGSILCTNIDECALELDDCAHNCNDTEGSFTCHCNEGYFLSENLHDCTDVNECSTQNISCDGEMVCINVEGSYSCGCNQGYMSLDLHNCTNVNECEGSNDCSEFAYCNDTDGSYECYCMEGYVGNGFNCSDVNECLLNKTSCHDLAYCVNDVGSYFCNCFAGYEGNGIDTCTDVNECEDRSLNNCSIFADCTNTEGSYSCTCQPGYEEVANGTICLCDDWNIRLTNGQKQSEGRVEVCFDNQYGTVCDDLWDELDATVVCRQLQYAGTGNSSVNDATHRSFFSDESRDIVLDNIICDGGESSLSECLYVRSTTGSISSCSRNEHAGVRCGEHCLDYEVRLNNFYRDDTIEAYFRNPSNYKEFFIREDKEELSKGKVEICVDGEWGTICEGHSWNNSAASVACHQLGFSRYGALDGDEAIAEESNVKMYEVTCAGTENNLTSCGHSFSSSSDLGCDNAFVICQDIETKVGLCTTGSVRLIDHGIPRENEGRIEICINNAWGTVCNYLFDKLDADVVCTQLGIAPGDHEVSMNYGSGSGPIFLEGVDCIGDEQELLSCEILSNVNDACTHTDDIGVFCQTFCSGEISTSVSYGNYSWPAGIAGGTVVSQQCYYSNFSSEFSGCFNRSSMVHRHCDRRGFWLEPNYSECPTRRSCQLLNITEMEISVQTATEVTMGIEMLLSAAPSEDQTVDNVAIVSNVLSEMVNFRDEITTEAFENAATFVSYVMSWPEETLEDKSSDIIESVEGLVEGLLDRENVPEVTVIEESLEVIVTRVRASQVPDSGYPFISSNSNSSISLPKDIFQDDAGVAFSAYTEASLFPLTNTNEKFSVASPVIGSVITAFDTSSLVKNVSISLPVIEGAKVPRCMFWDVTEGIWKSDGCTALSTDNSKIDCSCNHLTNFAIVANTNPVVCDAATHLENDDFTLCIERIPSAYLSLIHGLENEAFVTSNSPLTYNVKESQEFALLCETEPQFSATWFNSNNEMIQKTTPGNYPTFETAGQLYVHVRARNSSVLMSRGFLDGNDSKRVGVSQAASGKYKCVARNQEETQNKTVDVQVESGPLNLRVFFRFTANSSIQYPLPPLILQHYSTLIISSVMLTRQNVFAANCNNVGPNDRTSRRVECEVSAVTQNDLNILVSDIEKIKYFLTDNLAIQNFLISDQGFCDKETNVSTIHGNYTWMETAVGANSTSDCQFGPEDGIDISMAGVTRECRGPHMWAEYYGGYCITEVTAKFRQLGNRSLATAEDVADVVDQLNTIFSEGTSGQDQSDGNILVVLNVFSGAATLAENVTYTPTIVEDITGITSGLSDWPSEVLFNSSSKIVESFEVITENLVGQENFSNVSVESHNIALTGFRNDTDNLKEGIAFDYNLLEIGHISNDVNMDGMKANYYNMSGSGSGSGSGSSSSTTTPLESTNTVVNKMSNTLKNITPYPEAIENFSIYLPPVVFSNITDTSVGVLFSLYDTAALFPIRKELYSDFPDVVSPVIGASVVGINPLVNLTENVVMTIPLFENLPLNYSVRCVSWNFSAADERGNWSTAGCNLTMIKRGNVTDIATCQCNHLTNFAILVDVDTREKKEVKHDIKISVLSYIGVSLSIFGCIISIITLLGSKSLRGRDVTKFHIQLFISLLGLYLSYAIGFERRESEVLCTLSSIVILYFTLASIFWMGAEAVIMFKKLVVIFGSISNKFVLILSLISWFLPLPFVIAAIATMGDHKNYLIQVIEGGDREDVTYGYCFVSDLRVLIGVVFVPLIIVMILNIFMLAVALRVVIKQNRKKFFQGGDRHLMKMTVKNMISLIWLFILFGVGWIFGIFTIREASVAFQYLFVILNGFQGFYFFIFIVLNQKEARTFWTDIITRGRFTSRKTTTHNKVYANSSDYKVRKNLGYLTALPQSSNERKDQLVNYLSQPPPADVSLQDSFVCANNESTFETEMIPLEVTQTIRQADYSDTNSLIELTTYIDGTELGHESMTIDHKTTTMMTVDDQLPSIDNKVLMDEEDEEKTPIPPKRRKRKNRSSAKGNYRSEPVAHDMMTQQPTDEADIDTTYEKEEAKRRAVTVMRQTKVSSFGGHGISRQKQVEEGLQAPFVITNPLYAKEE